MRLSILTNPESVNVTIAGELDANAADECRRGLDDVAAGHQARVEINLSQLRIIDGVGVRLLFQFYKRMWEQDRDVVLRQPQGQPLAILKLARLDRLMVDSVPPIDDGPEFSSGAAFKTASFLMARPAAGEPPDSDPAQTVGAVSDPC